MEMSLFSAFDPFTGFFSYNYVVLFTFIFFFPMMYWYYNSRYIFIYMILISVLNKEYKILVGLKISGGLLIYVGLFLMILQFNLLGMFPFVFVMTSQLTLNLFFSFSFFLLVFILGWLNLSKIMFAHLTPMGSPVGLSPFLVLVELISFLIRPFTLAIRLTANTISGHILLDIMLGPSEKMNLIFSFIFFIFILPILILEIVVCFVQSFVISSLSSMYLGEPLSH